MKKKKRQHSDQWYYKKELERGIEHHSEQWFNWNRIAMIGDLIPKVAFPEDLREEFHLRLQMQNSGEPVTMPDELKKKVLAWVRKYKRIKTLSR